MSVDTVNVAPIKSDATLCRDAVSAARTYVKREGDLVSASVVLGQRIASIFDAGLVGPGKRFAGMGAVGKFLTEELAKGKNPVEKSFSLAYLASTVSAARAVEKGVSPADANAIVTLGTNAKVTEVLASPDATPAKILAVVSAEKSAKGVKAKAKAGEGSPKAKGAKAKGTPAKGANTHAAKVAALIDTLAGAKAMFGKLTPAEAAKVDAALVQARAHVRPRLSTPGTTTTKAKA